MQALHILCIDPDEQERLQLRDFLTPLEARCHLHTAAEMEEAQQTMQKIEDKGDLLAVVIATFDAPTQTGIEILEAIQKLPQHHKTRKIMLTANASLEDAIRAVNEARIDRLLEKPLDGEKLLESVKILLTEYIISRGMDVKNFPDILDQQTLLESIRRKGLL
jgi:two-component system chemotaxis response regulator CheY